MYINVNEQKEIRRQTPIYFIHYIYVTYAVFVQKSTVLFCCLDFPIG